MLFVGLLHCLLQFTLFTYTEYFIPLSSSSVMQNISKIISYSADNSWVMLMKRPTSNVQPFKGMRKTKDRATGSQGLRITQGMRLEIHLYCIDQEWEIQIVTTGLYMWDQRAQTKGQRIKKEEDRI